jgi:hypothetical protein
VTLLLRPSSLRRRRSGVSTRSAARLSRALTPAVTLLTPERVAQGRCAVGAVMLARPTTLPRLLGVDRVSAERTAWATQMLGAREVALGGGAWLALRRGDARAARLWLVAGLVADALDALAVGRAVGRGTVPIPAGVVAVSVATSAVGIQADALVSGRAR